MSDDPFVTSVGEDKVVLPKGSVRMAITEVHYAPISEWPEWKVQNAVDRHNEKELAFKEAQEKKGKEYAPRLAMLVTENGVTSATGLTSREDAQFVFYPKVIAGKYEGVKTRPIYTGVYLNGKKEYRVKANLYKLLDATLPDVEEAIMGGTVDVRDVVGYPFMAQLDITDQGNQKYVGFMQTEDHGTRAFEPVAEFGEEVEW